MITARWGILQCIIRYHIGVVCAVKEADSGVWGAGWSLRQLYSYSWLAVCKVPDLILCSMLVLLACVLRALLC